MCGWWDSQNRVCLREASGRARTYRGATGWPPCLPFDGKIIPNIIRRRNTMPVSGRCRASRRLDVTVTLRYGVPTLPRLE